METPASRISLKNDAAFPKTYLLSDNGSFLFRFASGAFGSKWAGLWHMDTKFMDYFAFRVDGEWIRPEKQEEFVYDGLKAEHVYRTDNGAIRELVALKEKFMNVRLVFENKPKLVELEIGVNIRYRDESLHNRQYELGGTEFAQVNNKLGELSFWSEGGTFIPDITKSKHRPGQYAIEQGYDWQEDEQEKFVPGKYMVRPTSNTVDFFFSLGGAAEDIESISRMRRNELDRLADKNSWVIIRSMQDFIGQLDDKAAFIAGFPYFNEFWARDFLWVTKGYLTAGFVDEVKQGLQLLESRQKSGGIPMLINSRTATDPSADSTPLWIIAVSEFVDRYGGLDGFKKGIEAGLLFGLRHLDGPVKHDPKLSWMDTVERHDAVEVQSLWAQAFRLGGQLVKNREASSAGKELVKLINAEYWDGSFYKDSLSGPFNHSANGLVPFLFDQAPKDRAWSALDILRNDLVTDCGVRAVSKNESGQGYHERVWGLTSYWGLKLLKIYDKPGFERLLDMYLKNFNKKTLYGIAETFMTSGQASGATSQLWSVGFLPELMNKGGMMKRLLGWRGLK
ncbi:MAG: hypothetical protein GOU99_02935 [Candidatus Altiarchaeota archaeon]|nr:hypothetical protein [Candidatus Altiarchaeota archaeon]